MGAGAAATQTMPHAASKYHTHTAIQHTIAWNPSEIKPFVMKRCFLKVLIESIRIQSAPWPLLV